MPFRHSSRLSFIYILMSSAGNNIYVTLVMLGGAYAKGVGVLAHTLRASGAKYPLYCMITDDVPAEARLFLQSHVDKLVLVPMISHESTPLKTKKQRDIYGGWINHRYTKWNCINPSLFPGVARCLFLDADMIIRENPDQLFDIPGVAGVFATPWAFPYMKTQYAITNPYANMSSRGPIPKSSAGKNNRSANSSVSLPRHGQLITKQQIRAGLTSSFTADASLMLLAPDSTAYRLMMRLLAESKEYGFPGCFSGNDEQLIADIMLQSTTGPYSQVHHIDPAWSCNLGKEDVFSPGVPVKISRYYNEKPWDGVSTRADLAEVLAKAKYPDLAEWWGLVEKIIAIDPLAEEIYFPGGVRIDGGAGPIITGGAMENPSSFLDSLLG